MDAIFKIQGKISPEAYRSAALLMVSIKNQNRSIYTALDKKRTEVEGHRDRVDRLQLGLKAFYIINFLLNFYFPSALFLFRSREFVIQASISHSRDKVCELVTKLLGFFGLSVFVVC